jgi:FtsP/CotA-like multicopper oxidase with cupredoxin domain
MVSFGLVIALAVAYVSVRAAQSPQVPMAGSAIPQFAQPLPLLDIAGGPLKTADGTGPLRIHMCEFDANVLPPGTFAVGAQPRTRVWGYIAEKPRVTWAGCPTTPQDTYLGPVILAKRNTATPITFINDLGNATDTGVLAYKYSTDPTLDWADPLNYEANLCNKTGGIPSPGTRCAENYTGDIPAAVHLHGGEVPPELDGGPDSWFTSSAGSYQGHGYYTKNPGTDPMNGAVYTYPNTQEASPIWFHDHVKGATRLNVYAGLAGGYLVLDPTLKLPAGLHAAGLSYSANNSTLDVITVPIILQDRMFDTNGQLFFPADSAGGLLWSVNPEHPYWVPEFLGDTIVVNGKAWPYFDVEPKRYRFLFLNGSNARTYEMFLVNPVTKVMGPSLSVIATDGGYLQTPATIDPNAATNNVLIMMPGERYEVIIDFSTVAPGTNLILRNNARSPYPKGAAPNGATTGRIMQFRVGPCASKCGATDTSFVPTPGTPIRPSTDPLVRLVNPATGALATGVIVAKTRQLTLNEVMQMPQTVVDPVTGILTAYPGGPLEILVNNTKLSGESLRQGMVGYGDFVPVPFSSGGATYTTYYSEVPVEGDTEVWEIVNLTADAHPMHLHLVQFQILNRQGFNTSAYPAAYALAFPGDGTAKCPTGMFCPGFGPPLNYNPSAATGNKWGGNPDVGAVGKNLKPLYLQGPIMPPKPWEAGWKDTIMVPPGQVTRIVVRWAPTSLLVSAPNTELYFPFDPSGGLENHGYVWHCHIIDHEDNEMMRPDKVELNPAAPYPSLRLLKKGIDY